MERPSYSRLDSRCMRRTLYRFSTTPPQQTGTLKSTLQIGSERHGLLRLTLQDDMIISPRPCCYRDNAERRLHSKIHVPKQGATSKMFSARSAEILLMQYSRGAVIFRVMWGRPPCGLYYVVYRVAYRSYSTGSELPLQLFLFRHTRRFFGVDGREPPLRHVRAQVVSVKCVRGQVRRHIRGRAALRYGQQRFAKGAPRG